MNTVAAGPFQTDSRAAELFALHQRHVHERTDRLFAILLALQWLGMVGASLWISPTTWIGELHAVHNHVWTALMLGGAVTVVPVFLVLVRPGWVGTRHTVAVAQALHSTILIHLTGGRPETHFHVFGSLAFIAFYRDWKVLVTMTAVVAADHFWRGVFWPQSVFGVALNSPWRWVEHVAWVVFQDVFLISACLHNVREMRLIASDRAKVEGSRDIIESEVRLQTGELRTSRAAAEAASTAKSEFLANMSHEIRTPMTAILGYTDLLNHADTAGRERGEMIDIIRRNGDHLLSLINDILDLSKIEAGQSTVETTRCSAIEIAAEVGTLMRVRAATRGISLNTEFVYPLPASIATDGLRLKQILVNLVGNAVKFTERGGVRLVVRMNAPTTPSGPALMAFEIHDTGIGLSEEQISRLFRPFVQADASVTRKFGGTGLGLTISKRLAEMLGGEISVRSSQGGGSTFTVRIACGSLHGVPMLTCAADVAPAPAALPPTPSTSRLAGRVLLVEDGPDNQRLIAFHLRNAGAEVTIAEHGGVALREVEQATIENRPFALILMDMQMPEMDGYTATAELRKRGVTIPVIALTAHAMSGDREKCVAAGCDAYATKPIDKSKLLSQCAEWIESGRRRVVPNPAPDAVPAGQSADHRGKAQSFSE